MKVKIGGKIFDSEEEPIMLIFDDDMQRKKVAFNLYSMKDENKVRKYLEYNDKKVTVKEAEEFMKI